MTPLAHRIVRELTVPLKERTFRDQDNLLRRMDDIHCFEITEIRDAAFQLANTPEAFYDSDCISFLPAPKTWLEYMGPKGNKRTGYLLEELGNGRVRSTCVAEGIGYCSFAHPELDEEGWGVLGSNELDLTARYSGDQWNQDALIPAYMLFINSPRVIGRRQHMPHRGLERKLIAQRKMIGHFPLHAWTEIKLEINPRPGDHSGEPSQEAHLTGQRALHFCRAHLRVRLGRLEVVRAHWRGDASLGIKRSRYKLTVPTV